MRFRGHSGSSIGALAAGALLLLAHLPTAHGTTCLELTGRFANGPATAVDTDGDLVAVGRGSILQIVDVSTAVNPVPLGSLELPDDIVRLVIADDHVYAVCGLAGLRVVDIGSPSNPVEVGWVDTADRAVAVDVAGDVAYVAVRDSGLRIIDVGTPSSPIEIASVHPQSNARDVVVSNGLAYLAADVDGFRIIDVSSPADPTEIGFLDDGWAEWFVAVSSSYAYLYSGGHYLRVIDVSSPSGPIEVSRVATLGNVRDIEVANGFAYIANDFNGLRVYDVRTPAAPIETGYLYEPGASVLDSAISGTVAYLADEAEGLRVVDATFAVAPREIASLDDVFHASTVAVSGDHVLVAGGGFGLRVIDVDSSTGPEQVGFLDHIGVAEIEQHGRLAFSVGSDTLHVIDPHRPEMPRIVGSVELPASPYGLQDIAFADHTAYVIDARDNLFVVDVSEPSTPAQVGMLDTIDYLHAVAASDDTVFVAAGYQGLVSVDVSSPEAPTVLASLEPGSHAFDVEVADGVAYVADSLNGLQIVDVGTPSEPIEIATFDTPGRAVRVALMDSLALVADASLDDGPTVLRVIDVSTPSAPVELCALETRGYPEDLEVSNCRAFLAQGDAGLSVFKFCDLIHSYWIGTVARIPGLFGSHWRTDVVVRNTGSRTASAMLRFHDAGAIVQLDNQVSPGNQAVFEDILGLMGVDGKGWLEIVSDELLQVSGRIYNRTEAGTFGQFVSGDRPTAAFSPGMKATLLQLRQLEGKFRTNISITNTGNDPARLRFRLFDASGDQLIVYTVGVGARSLLQDPEPFKIRAGRPDLGWGFAEFEVLAGSDVLVSASVVDSVTNDATTVNPIR